LTTSLPTRCHVAWHNNDQWDEVTHQYKLTRLAMTIVSTMAGVELVPRTNWRPRGGFPVNES